MAVERLNNFHRIVRENSARNFEVFSFNDGAVAYRDLSLRANTNAADFLCRCYKLHSILNKFEEETGHPGARMVIACGLRIRSSKREPRNDTHAESIRARFKSGSISAEQAIEEALNSKPYAGIAPSLMANFAFTKAYLVEQSGTSAGFAGSKCYVDMALFDNVRPWISLGPKIEWQSRGMSGNFCSINQIDLQAAGVCKFEGLRNGIGVGEAVTDDPSILASLRSDSASHKQRG